MVHYPNLRAEMTRRNVTAIDVVEGILKESDVQISVSHFSQKLKGKYSFTLKEAFALRNS